MSLTSAEFRVGITLLAACFLAGCADSSRMVAIQESQELTLAAESLDSIKVETANGNVFLEGRPQPGRITVRVKKRAGGSSPGEARAAMEALEILARPVGNTQHLGWRWKTPPHPRWTAQVSFEITLPTDFRTEVLTHNGTIRSLGLTGDCRHETRRGGIEAEGLAGNAHLESGNGDVVVQGRPRRLVVSADNGEVRADLRDCETLGGSITTGNGPIEIRIGRGTRTVLQCETHNGDLDARLQLEDAVHRMNRLTGRHGFGGDLLRIVAHNGSLTLSY